VGKCGPASWTTCFKRGGAEKICSEGVGTGSRQSQRHPGSEGHNLRVSAPPRLELSCSLPFQPASQVRGSGRHRLAPRSRPQNGTTSLRSVQVPRLRSGFRLLAPARLAPRSRPQNGTTSLRSVQVPRLRSGFRLLAPARLAPRSRPQNGTTSLRSVQIPRLRSGFCLRTPARLTPRSRPQNGSTLQKKAFTPFSR